MFLIIERREDTAGKTELSSAELLSVSQNVCFSFLIKLYQPGVFFLNLIFMPS